MNDRQKTEFIKMCLFYHFRIKSNCSYICSEFGKGNSDIFAEKTENKRQYEVEIKVSKSDFKKEFLNESDSFFKRFKHSETENSYKIMYFYVCVPEELVEYAKDIFNSDVRFKNYGIMICDFSDTTLFKNRVKIIRNAKKQAEYTDLKNKIISRMSSEIFCSKKQFVQELIGKKISSIGKIES